MEELWGKFERQTSLVGDLQGLSFSAAAEKVTNEKLNWNEVVLKSLHKFFSALPASTFSEKSTLLCGSQTLRLTAGWLFETLFFTTIR